jgi:hypothetical protein
VSYTYTSEIAAAQAAIDEYGAAMVIQRGGPTGTSYPCFGLIASYTAIERATSAIQWTDRKVWIASADLPIVPDPEQDQAIFTNQVDNIPAGTPLRIVTTGSISPGGIPILFELQVRR